MIFRQLNNTDYINKIILKISIMVNKHTDGRIEKQLNLLNIIKDGKSYLYIVLFIKNNFVQLIYNDFLLYGIIYIFSNLFNNCTLLHLIVCFFNILTYYFIFY